jgi:hypothetical protein
MAHIPRRTALASLGHPLSAALQMAGLLFQSLCKYALVEAKDKRQTEELAKPLRSVERIPSSIDPCRQIVRWLLPRIG